MSRSSRSMTGRKMWATILGAAAFLLLSHGALEAQAWEVVGQMPVERGQTIAVVLDGGVHLLTGSAPGLDATGLHERFDPAAGSWTQLAPMPDIASHAGAAVLNGRIYVVAGFVANVHAGAMPRVFEYDPSSDSWRAVAPLSVQRGSAGVTALNGRIHAIDGRNEGGLVGAHEVYDPASDTWSEAPPVPTPRSGGASFELGRLLVFAGGECRPTQPPSTCPEVEEWDPEAGTWLSLPPFPEGRHAFAAATVEGTAYVLGGRTGCGGSGPTLEVLALPSP